MSSNKNNIYSFYQETKKPCIIDDDTRLLMKSLSQYYIAARILCKAFSISSFVGVNFSLEKLIS